MSKTEWYRRTSWSNQDQEDFNTRLNRSRGAGNKAQYLCIQAGHLAEAGHDTAALELLDRFFAEFPEQRTLLSLAHGLKAECLDSLGQIDAAVDQYRAALKTERTSPSSRTNAWLNFGWLVVKRQLTDLYNEVSRILDEFREDEEEDIRFPANEYRYFAIQALLAEARGERKVSRTFARKALAEADKEHSGLRYHPGAGLVGQDRATFERRLCALAGK